MGCRARRQRGRPRAHTRVERYRLSRVALGRIGQVLCAPLGHCLDHRAQRRAEVGERVPDPHWLFAHERPVDQPAFLEVVEALREDLAGDAVDVPFELVEPAGAVFEQPVDDYGMPLLADQRGRRRDRAPLLASAPDFECGIGLLGAAFHSYIVRPRTHNYWLRLVRKRSHYQPRLRDEVRPRIRRELSGRCRRKHQYPRVIR